MDNLFIQELKAKAGLSGIISRYVRLTYKNGSYLGCCPFHNEKTPSFTVNDAKGIYHCFGCNASGDVISFLQKHLSLSFSDAISELCLQTGTPLPTFNKENNKKKETDILEESLLFMQDSLRKSPSAQVYLKKRGINDDIIKHFSISLMPNGKDSLFKHLQSKFSTEDIIKSGLCMQSPYNKNIIDRFQNRIMFPIHSHSGSVVGFSGRIFNGEENIAKYINSPETELFKKSYILYNFHNARKTKERFCIVTEGFMDVIAFYKDGIPNTVAQMGTAFTKHHLSTLVSRFEEVIFCLDGDTAGKKASERVIEMLFENLIPEKKFSFIALPNSKDPDAHFEQNGVGSLKTLVEQRLPLHEYTWVLLSENLDLQDPAASLALEQRLVNITKANKEKSIQKHYEHFFKNKIYQSRFAKERKTVIITTTSSPQKYREYEGMAVAFLYQYHGILQQNFEALLIEYEFYITTNEIADIIQQIESSDDVSEIATVQEILTKYKLPHLQSDTEIQQFYMLIYHTSMLEKIDYEIRETKDFAKISFLITEKNKILANIKLMHV